MKVIGYCLVIIFAFLVDFLVCTALVWGICSCLPLIGVTTLFGWVVQFSWPLAFIVWAIEWAICQIVKSGRKS